MAEDLTTLRDRLLKKTDGNTSSGSHELLAKYPCLAELFQKSPTSPTGKPGFGLGLTFESPSYQVCVSWHTESLVAFFLTDHPDDLLGQVERRLEDGTLDWRTSRFKWR